MKLKPKHRILQWEPGSMKIDTYQIFSSAKGF